MKLIEDMKPLEWMQVGSTVTCSPAPKDADVDYIILYKDRSYVMFMNEFQLDGEGHYEPNEGNFSSWRKDNINLIITDSADFYNKFVLATKIAKRLNLLNKKDRIDLFQAILYGNI